MNKAVKGMRDLVNLNLKKHKYIIEKVENILKRFHYNPILLNLLEHEEVFKRTLGETSEIITKEMFTLKDLSNNNLVLRPEGTASLMRYLLENNLQFDLPAKYYYHGPMFRYEKPQKNRLRQFYQIGLENLGSKDFFSDVETIYIANQILKEIFRGKEEFTIEINTLGNPLERGEYNKILTDFYNSPDIFQKLSDLSKLRIEKKNPLRIFDSKEQIDIEISEKAPKMFSVLGEESKSNFERILKSLNQLGINPRHNPRLVRGLDYYCHVCFEIKPKNEEFSQSTILGGGRYDFLADFLIGKEFKIQLPTVPAVGFALGIDRVSNLIKDEDEQLNLQNQLKIGLICISKGCTDTDIEKIKLKFFEIIHKFQNDKLSFEMIFGNRKIEKQFEYLDKKNFDYALIIGHDELRLNEVQLKNLKNRESEKIDLLNLSVELFMIKILKP